MHTPLHQLAQQQHLNSEQTQALWQLAGLHAPPPDVHHRLRQALALVAALLLGAGLIFWVAANWDVQSRLFKLHLLQAAAVVPLAVVGQAEAGLSVAEIAQVTGVGLQMAKSRLRYARAALRQQLEGMA